MTGMQILQNHLPSTSDKNSEGNKFQPLKFRDMHILLSVRCFSQIIWEKILDAWMQGF